MSIDSTVNRNPYTGNDIADEFDFDFKITDESQLLIVEETDEGVISAKTVPTHYTVTGVGEETGGTITRVAGALPTDYRMVVRRRPAATQGTDIRNQGAFYPEVHEDAFDFLVMLIQATRTEADQAVKAAETDDIALNMRLPPAALRAGRYLGFDGDGQPIALDLLSATLAVQELVGFTLTTSWPTNTILTVKATLTGFKLRVQAKLALTGAPDSADLTLTLPGAYVVDESEMISPTRQIVGRNCHVVAAGGTPVPAMVIYDGALKVVLDDFSAVDEAAPGTFTSGDEVVLDFEVPIE